MEAAYERHARLPRRCARRSGVRRRHVELERRWLPGEQLPETIGDHVGSGAGRRAHEESGAVVDEHLRCADGVWRQRGAGHEMHAARTPALIELDTCASIVPKGNASRRHPRPSRSPPEMAEMAGGVGDGGRWQEGSGDGGRWREMQEGVGGWRELAGAGPVIISILPSSCLYPAGQRRGTARRHALRTARHTRL